MFCFVNQESIRKALDGLCKHLPKNLAPECEDFVQTYTQELVEMLIADLTPQEVCVYLKLCAAQPTKEVRPWAHVEGFGSFEERKFLKKKILENLFFIHLNDTNKK